MKNYSKDTQDWTRSFVLWLLQVRSIRRGKTRVVHKYSRNAHGWRRSDADSMCAMKTTKRCTPSWCVHKMGARRSAPCLRRWRVEKKTPTRGGDLRSTLGWQQKRTSPAFRLNRSRFKLSLGSICLEKLLSGLHDARGFIIRDFASS